MECSTLTFDNTQLEELEQYFADLQVLLELDDATNHNKCKQAVLKYLKIQMEKLWKTTHVWLDQTKTFEEFKEEVYTLYPGATGDRIYMIQDLDTLIGYWACVGIITVTDLGEYYH